MKERPILFSAPMVLAILSGQKAQTRRIVKPQTRIDPRRIPDGFCSLKCPYGVPGDRLWVRETWGTIDDGLDCDDSSAICYRATETAQWRDRPHAKEKRANGMDAAYVQPQKWRPSIFMPRWASRITLETTDIGIERLNELTTEDAIKEGCRFAGFPASLTDVGAFAKLWEKINGKGSWAANPYVWVVSFRRIK